MDYFVADYAGLSLENANWNNNNNNTINNGAAAAQYKVDDLLDFSKEDETMTDAFFDMNSGESSTVTAIDSCNSSVSGGGDGQFNGNVSGRSFNESQFSGNELCVPYDDLAELEWLSNFVEESFSNDDLHFIPAQNVAVSTKTTITDTSSSATTVHAPPVFPSDVSVPGKARSKRSRAAPCNWSSRILHLSPSSKSEPSKKRSDPTDTPGRKCQHCLSEKTPQWRTGPMGPKTLCNACGVRYKSGRLVPEYRPASSPTFISTKHSNSHRKVMELRRQKEVQIQHHNHHPQMINQASIINGCDEFLIHHRSNINGHDFRHMI